MFIDLALPHAPRQLEADVCVVGGGMAGITLALEFARSGIAAVVLEGGGLGPEAGTRDLARGSSSDIPYQFADGCRSRYLGGSSNCWGGWCRPLDDIDYESREWVPNSGWPFGEDVLAPYLARAHRVLKLGPLDYDTERWVRQLGRSDVRRFPFAGSLAFDDAISQFSPPVRMGLDYLPELTQAQDVKVCVHANVVAMHGDAEGSQMHSVLARSLNGAQLEVRATLFVLAAGGIENARLLLACGPRPGHGWGNGHGLVGRYFMDHPRIASGRVTFAKPWRRNKLYDHKFHYQNPGIAVAGTRFGAQLKLKPQIQRDEGLLNANLWFESLLPGDGTPAAEVIIRLKHRLERKEKQGYSLLSDLAQVALRPVDSAGFVLGRVFQPEALIRGVRMAAIVEPEPDPESRVTLGSERDALGMPRVVVGWRLSDNVKRTFDRNFTWMARMLQESGVGSVELDAPIGLGDWPRTFSDEGTWHHMGTTRMHASPRQGVVNVDGALHEAPNVFVAGSSVFPTAGANFPSITLVALALRLADHLKSELRRIRNPVLDVSA